MRLLIILLLFLSSCSSKMENKKSLEANEENENPLSSTIYQKTSIFELNDTTFFYRKIINDFYHVVYIDTNRNSKHYSLLADFEFDEGDIEEYESSYSHIKSKLPNSYKKVNNTDIPKNWIPVYPYQNKYYLYRPSDLGNRGRRIVNDSSFVYWYMSGLLPRPLINIEQQSPKKYKLEIAGFENDTYKIEELIIHKIDQKTGLSIFEYPNEEKEGYRYKLYIPKESAKHFDVVINYCNSQKTLEFVFDEIDYKGLIENSN